MTTYTIAGSTSHFSVLYDSTMGAAGAAMATDMLATCEADWRRISDAFRGRGPSGGPIRVKIEQATGDGTNDLVLRTGTNLRQARQVLESELTEMFRNADESGGSARPKPRAGRAR